MNTPIKSFCLIMLFSISMTHAVKIGYGLYNAQEEAHAILENEKKVREIAKNDFRATSQVMIEKCNMKDPLTRFESIHECSSCYKAMIAVQEAVNKLPMKDRVSMSDNDKKYYAMLAAISVHKMANFSPFDILEELLRSGELTPAQYTNELWKIHSALTEVKN